MFLSATRPWARICRKTCSQPVPLCFIAAIWSSVSGFGPFALPAEGAPDGDGVVVLRAPFVVVVVVGMVCASNSARATLVAGRQFLIGAGGVRRRRDLRVSR